ncbi:YycH family regulatory protein [Pseudalkalibacillus sp. R45]|uniref:YycH family regulatory protein n=1 Tax=Pseudalkalibacillus sp. R45 TaxID=3457433 RepID=UPI003FCC3AE2
MQMRRITRQLKKFYSAIWDNIENLKTVLLSLLILLSIFLTYNLWTFTPNNKVLENERTIETKIPEGKTEKLANIIQPRQIILHQGGEHFWSYAKDQNEIYDLLQTTLLISNSKKTVEYETDIQSNGLEIIYPTSIPVDVLKETFRFSNENPFANKKDNVERLRVYDSEGKWKIQFIFEPEGNPQEPEQLKDPVVFEFQLSNISINTLIDKMVSSEKTVQVEQFELEDNHNSFYLPVENVKIPTHFYTTNQIDIKLFVQALLPSNVATKKSDDRIMYSKSKSMITYFEELNEFSYINWNSQEDVIRRNPIIQSLDFINNHAGWTNKYHIYHYYDSTQDDDTTNRQKEIAYRMIMNGFPVMDESVGKISLKWTTNQADEYERSLTYLKDPIENKSAPPVVMEKGSEVIEALSATAPNTKNISDITIGYTLKSENEHDTYFSLEPAWYYKIRSSWLPLDFPVDEPMSNQGG